MNIVRNIKYLCFGMAAVSKFKPVPCYLRKGEKKEENTITDLETVREFTSIA